MSTTVVSCNASQQLIRSIINYYWRFWLVVVKHSDWWRSYCICHLQFIADYALTECSPYSRYVFYGCSTDITTTFFWRFYWQWPCFHQRFNPDQNPLSFDCNRRILDYRYIGRFLYSDPRWKLGDCELLHLIDIFYLIKKYRSNRYKNSLNAQWAVVLLDAPIGCI